jgi:hypothetical protein
MNAVLEPESAARYYYRETPLRFLFRTGGTKQERGVQRGPPLAYGGLLKKVRNKLALLSAGILIVYVTALRVRKFFNHG